MSKKIKTGYDHCTSESKWFTLNPPQGSYTVVSVSGLLTGEEVVIYRQVGSDWVEVTRLAAPADEFPLAGPDQYMVDARGVAQDTDPCPKFFTCTFEGEIPVSSAASSATDPTAEPVELIECIMSALPGLMDKTTGGTALAKSTPDGIEYFAVQKTGGLVAITEADLVPATLRTHVTEMEFCGVDAWTFQELIEETTGLVAADICRIVRMSFEVTEPFIPNDNGMTAQGYAAVEWAGGGETKHFNCTSKTLMENAPALDCIDASVLAQTFTLDDGVCAVVRLEFELV